MIALLNKIELLHSNIMDLLITLLVNMDINYYVIHYNLMIFLYIFDNDWTH